MGEDSVAQLRRSALDVRGDVVDCEVFPLDGLLTFPTGLLRRRIPEDSPLGLVEQAVWSAAPMLAGEPRYGPFNHRKDFGMVGRQVSADIVEAVTSMLGLVFFDVNDELAGASDGEQFVDERHLGVGQSAVWRVLRRRRRVACSQR